MTLIEVAVGLAIGALLCAMLAGMLVHTRQASDLMRERATQARRGRAPFETLAADLRSLAPGGRLRVAQGVLTCDTLNALAPPIQASRFAVEARYGVAEWEGAKTLVRAERLRDADQNHLVVSLASPIEAITFEVFDGKQWRSEWPPANRLVGVALRVGLSTVAASETRTFALAPMEWTP